MKQFYFIFGYLTELSLFIPIILGGGRWKKIPRSLRFILCFVIADFVLNLIQNYYAIYLRANNLFLSYYYSLAWMLLLSGFFWSISAYKKYILLFMTTGVLAVILEYKYFYIPGEMNYYSGFFVNVVIFSMSMYHFSKFFSDDKRYFINQVNPVSLALLGLCLQFFARSIDMLFKKFLFQTNFYMALWYHESITYYYIVLLATGIYAFSFYSIKYEN